MKDRISDQLPIDIIPTDDDEREISTLSISCPHCKEVLTEKELRGTVGHDTIKKVIVSVDCTCAYCEQEVKETYKFELYEGQLMLQQKSGNTWHRIQLLPE